MSRALLWPLTLTLSTGGLLAGHELAYRLAGEGDASLHAYLAHAPQLVLVLALPAALLAVSATRRGTPRPLAFALVGTSGFVLMEHLERLGAGGLPWLLTHPVFLLGLALQLPFAAAAWWTARLLLRLEPDRPRRPRRLPAAWLALATPVLAAAVPPAGPPPRLRAPPPLL